MDRACIAASPPLSMGMLIDHGIDWTDMGDGWASHLNAPGLTLGLIMSDVDGDAGRRVGVR